jgi:amino acid transporter
MVGWLNGVLGLEPGRMRRFLPGLSLLALCVGSMVGTGWVEAVLVGADEAGHAVVVSWILGAAAMFFLAFVYAELGRRLPAAGGGARYSYCAFGRTAGFFSAWINWSGAVTVAPIQATVAAQSLVALEPALRTPPTPTVVAALLVTFFAVVNGIGISWLTRVNAVATIFKIAIPILTVFLLVGFASHTRSLTLGSVVELHGFGDIKSILQAVATSGIIFAYQGFEQAVNFGSEARTPNPGIGRAIMGALAAVFCFYLALQVTFIIAFGLDKGRHLGVTTELTANPFVAAADLVNHGGPTPFGELVLLTGIISPASVGLLYVGGSARLAYAAAKSGDIPRSFADLNPRRVPLLAIAVAQGLALLLLLPSPRWEPLVEFNTSTTVLGFALQPMALSVFRRTGGFPEHPAGGRRGGLGRISRVLKAPLPPVALVIASWIVLFDGWPVNRLLLFLVMPAGMVLFVYSQLRRPRRERPSLNLVRAFWLPIYLVGVGTVSWLSSFQGTGQLPFGADILAMGVVSVGTYFAAVRWGGRTPEQIRESMREIESDMAEPDEAGHQRPALRRPA